MKRDSQTRASYLSAARGVLRRTTSDKHRIAFFKVFKKTQVLLVGKNGVIGFQAIFLEESLVTGLIWHMGAK